MFKDTSFDSTESLNHLTDEEVEFESLSNMTSECGRIYEFAMPNEVRDTIQSLMWKGTVTLQGAIITGSLPFGLLSVEAEDVKEQWSEDNPSEVLCVQICFDSTFELNLDNILKVNDTITIGTCRRSTNGLITYKALIKLDGQSEHDLQELVRDIVDDARNVCKKLQIT